MNKKIKFILTPIATTLITASAIVPMISMTSCSADKKDTGGEISPEAIELYNNALAIFKDEICPIPHQSDGAMGSQKLSNIRAKIKQIATERFHERIEEEFHQDKYGNVWYDLPATLGMENAKKMILQGHMDMVWAVSKESGLNPDVAQPIETEFDLDPNGNPIALHSKGRKTSLGSDDGVFLGVALALTRKDIFPHGPLRILLTADEEPGLLGASKIGIMEDGSKIPVIDSDYLLNFDCEVEGEMVVSCAGGYSYKYFVKNFGTKAIKNIEDNEPVMHLSVSGLLGGHSAVEIHHGRANAIRVITDFLSSLKCDYKLCSIGTTTIVTNAIPTDADFYFIPVATTAIDKPVEHVKTKLQEYISNFKAKFPREIKAKIELKDVTATDRPTKCLSEKISYHLNEYMNRLLYGPITYLDEKETMLESSSNVSPASLNLANAGTDDKPQFAVSIYSRAARNELMKLIQNYSDTLGQYVANLLQDDVEGSDDAKLEPKEIASFPPFQIDLNNKMPPIVIKANNAVGIKTVEAKIHGGLECALWAHEKVGLNQVSIGPRIDNAHSPDELLDLISFKKNCQVLKSIMAQMKDAQ